MLQLTWQLLMLRKERETEARSEMVSSASRPAMGAWRLRAAQARELMMTHLAVALVHACGRSAWT